MFCLCIAISDDEDLGEEVTNLFVFFFKLMQKIRELGTR